MAGTIAMEKGSTNMIREVTDAMILQKALEFLSKEDSDIPCCTLRSAWCDDHCADDEGPHEYCWREFFRKECEKDLARDTHETILIQLKTIEKYCLLASKDRTKLSKDDLVRMAAAANDAIEYIEEGTGHAD